MALKILIPAWSFFPSQEGGPSNALYWLASGLAYAGYDVRVATTNRCISTSEIVENKWVKLNGFEVIYGTVEDHYTLIEKEIKKCDVLLTSGVCSIKNFKTNIKALRLGKKVILSPRGELFDSAVYHKGKVYGFLKLVMFYIMKKSYGRKVLYHATSVEEIEAIKKYMGKKARIQLIPNYMILEKKIEIKKESKENYLLYVGRLNPIKNIDIILSGLAQSSCFINSDYKFKIAGETVGDYYNKLVEQVDNLGLKDKIVFLGLVTGDEKKRLYAEAKCLFLLSKSENFGNVVVEALSQGTPVIASKGTPWEQLNEKSSGWWIDAQVKDVAIVTDDLLSLEDTDYLKMRESAYNFSQEFDIFSNISKWKEIIDN